MAPMTDEASTISMSPMDSNSTAFSWRGATTAQRRVVVAAALGWMLDAFDVMLYSIVLATLMRAFAMSRTTAGLLNALTLIASALGGLLFGVLADRYRAADAEREHPCLFGVHVCVRTVDDDHNAGGVPIPARAGDGGRVEYGRGTGGGVVALCAARAGFGDCAEQLGGGVRDLGGGGWPDPGTCELALGFLCGDFAGGAGVLDSESCAGAGSLGASAGSAREGGSAWSGPRVSEGAGGADGGEHIWDVRVVGAVYVDSGVPGAAGFAGRTRVCDA